MHSDGFDVLDVCHRHTLFALGKLVASAEPRETP